MDEELAKLLVAAGMLVGGAFWVTALALYQRMAGAPRSERFESNVGERPPAEAIDAVLTQSRELLASPRSSYAPPRIARPDAKQLVIEQAGMELRVDAVRGRQGTILSAEVEDVSYTRKYLFWFGVFVLILMPLVIGGVGAALWHFAAPHPSEAARWQSVQIVQIVHVLWPPFLIYGLWKRQRTQLITQASNLLVFAQARTPEKP